MKTYQYVLVYSPGNGGECPRGITPHRAPPHEELDLSYNKINKEKLLPPELHYLTPVCTNYRLGLRPADATVGAYSAPQTL